MNAALTTERVYERIRAGIMAREYLPGERLEPTLLAEVLSSSITPVRDALHLLTGQGLVEPRSGGGFQMPSLDEPALKDIYRWSAELLAVAMRVWPDPGGMPAPPSDGDVGTIADRAARNFLLIGRRSINGEHGWAIARLNARLHAVRTVENHAIGNLEEEMDELEAACNAFDRDRLRRLISAYHRRRSRASAAIVRAMYRTE